ncbi:MAG TPA: outer membrane beta-barrel protein [Candidatus Polarisedimenticolia bacterium]|nr:outer membrane beta-barrel protein [Candidatus Polarisedimenticolia bacterium]
MVARRHVWRSATFVGVVSLALLAAAAAPARAGEFTGDINFVLGQKFLNDGDWEPVETQPGGIVEMTWGDSDWPISLATDIAYSSGSDNTSSLDVDGSTAEFAIGVREIRNTGDFHYYVGLGFNMLRAEAKVKSSGSHDEDQDTGVGGWGGAGIFWRMGSRFNVGLSARYSRTEVTLFDENVQAGGFSYGLLVGWGWPASQ